MYTGVVGQGAWIAVDSCETLCQVTCAVYVWGVLAHRAQLHGSPALECHIFEHWHL